jgi:hypothetical protein
MAKKVLEYEYHIDLNERGYYNAHVEEAESGKIICEINNEQTYEDENGDLITEYGEITLVQDGYMKHGEDMTGLENYLIEMEVIPKYSRIKFVG